MQERITEIRTIIDRNGDTLTRLRTDIDAYGGDGEPVLILDDVFASLDEQRRRALAQMVAGAPQVLLTAAVDDDVPAELAGARYHVADGEVTRG